MPLEWVRMMTNLGNIYLDRIYGDRNSNVEKAISIYKEASQTIDKNAFPFDWAKNMMSLGSAYFEYGGGDRLENIKQATDAYQAALAIQTIDLSPIDYQMTQKNLGNFLFGKQEWHDAQTAYQGAIQAGQFLLDTAYTESGRKSEVHQTAQLYMRLAYCSWQLDQPVAALRHLEQGKTRLLGQNLALSEINLTMLSTEQQAQLRTLRQAIRELEGEMHLPLDTPARRDERTLANLLRDTREQLSQQITSIREEHPDFIPLGLAINDILATIPTGGTLVIPCVTSQGSFVFVLPSGIQTVTNNHILPLPDLTDDIIQAWLKGSEKNPGWLRAYTSFLSKDQSAFPAWQAHITKTLPQVWKALMQPIHQRLQTIGISTESPVLLIPPGGLSLLPLHAAGPEIADAHGGKTFADSYTVTYVPSAYALQVSQRRARQPQRQIKRLWAAINPTKDPKLQFTPLEGEAVARLFSPDLQTVLWEEAATRDSCLTQAPRHSHLHFSCHGNYGWDDPLNSGLLLANGEKLTLADLFQKMNLDTARLVTLSACETGITEFNQSPDEYVGLPAGFLQAGSPAVVSTLWAVNDLSTMLLMERFYQLYLEDGLVLPEALRQAQLWLRDVTAVELADRFYEEQLAILSNRMTMDEASQYWNLFAGYEKGERPFAHPVYWAPFTFTGS